MSVVAPSEIEEAIRTCWKSLLGRQDIRLEDDFFLLGGDSLIGALLISSLGDLSGSHVTLLDLYDHPTLGAQVELVARLRESAAS